MCGSHATPMYPHPACFLWTEKTGSTQHREHPGDKETRCPTSSMEFSVPFPAQGGCILSYLASLWRNFQLKQPLLGLKCAPTEASCLRCSAIPTAIAVSPQSELWAEPQVCPLTSSVPHLVLVLHIIKPLRSATGCWQWGFTAEVCV